MPNKLNEVGYGNPPTKGQFKPGQSGNAKGRPKGKRNLVTDLMAELSQKLLITEGGQQHRITKQQAMLKALLAKSLKGDVRAATALLRLIPSAEIARQAAADAATMTVADKDILQALREQLLAEISVQKGEHPHGK